MQLIVNGQEIELAGELPLLDLLDQREVPVRQVAVAINGEVLDRESFGAVTLRAGDTVEIVRMVGGG